MPTIRWQAGALRLADEPAPRVAAPGLAVVRPLRAAWLAGEIDPDRSADGVIAGLHGVGLVESVSAADGPAAERLVGSRVVSIGAAACSTCALCRAGLSAHCPSRRTPGADADGWLADRTAVPLASIAAFPEQVGTDRAVLTGLVAAALAAARATPTRGLVTVVGDGVVGLVAAQVIAEHSKLVRVLGGSPHLAVCERWGIKHRPIAEAGRRQDQDAVLVAAPDAASIGIAARLVRPRGTIVLAAGVRDADPLLLRAVRDLELTIVGSRAGPGRDAIDLLARGAVDTTGLAGPRTTLEQAAATLRLDPQGPAGSGPLATIVDIGKR